jgi:hypothetical protein
MNWFWLNVPVGVLFVAAWAGIPHASEVTVYQVRSGSDEWLALAPSVAKVQLPDHADGSRAKRVPRTCCTCSGTQPPLSSMSRPRHRISPGGCSQRSPDGLAWGTVNLPGSAWEHAPATRGLEPAQRALAHNLARYAHAV